MDEDSRNGLDEGHLLDHPLRDFARIRLKGKEAISRIPMYLNALSANACFDKNYVHLFSYAWS